MSSLRFRTRWLAGSLLAGTCSLLHTGCTQTAANRNEVVPTVRLFALPPTNSGYNEKNGFVLENTPKPIVPVAHQTAQPEQLPNLPAPEPIAAEERSIPINLDTVLRLAEAQNVQVALARERLNESETEQRLAAKAWLPKVNAGVAYYRHEGGIQNEDGTLTHSSTGALYSGLDIAAEMDLREATFVRVNAERQAWQQRGEVSKVTSETLLEAATTYLDLLTARRGEAVARELEKYLLDVQERAEKLVMPEDRSAQILVEMAQAEVSARRQAIAKLHQQGDAASAKLAYLLGMSTCVKMVPVEEALTPIDLVDPTPPANDLVARALTNGPGVRELQSLLSAVQEGLDRMSGPMRLMPTVRMTMLEGAFGAGPGGELSYDNRWDTCVQVRWNLNDFLNSREQRRLAESRVEQARLNYDDLRGKLAMGIQEARDASLVGREQIRFGAEQIKHAAAGYRLSDERVKMRVPNASLSDVMLAIRGLEMAHYSYLTAINAYNKSQIRLLVLLGPTATK